LKSGADIENAQTSAGKESGGVSEKKGGVESLGTGIKMQGKKRGPFVGSVGGCAVLMRKGTFGGRSQGRGGTEGEEVPGRSKCD